MEKGYCDVEELEDCNGKYNLQDSSILSDKPGRGTMIRVPPSRFLKLTTGKKDPSPSEAKALGIGFQSKDEIHESMCNGEPLDPMFLEYDQDKQKITGHEGRQRAMVAKQAGVSGIPVKLFCEERKDGRIRTTQCNITSGIDLSRKAESQSDITQDRYQDRAKELRQNCEQDI